MTQQTLIHLNLSWNSINKFTDRFTPLLHHNNSLKSLRLEYCDLGNDAAEALAVGVAGNRCLQDLYLSGNGIGDEGLEHFVNYVFMNRRNSTLKVLDVANNLISDVSATSLLQTLETVPVEELGELCVVVLDSNELSDEVQNAVDRLFGIKAQKKENIKTMVSSYAARGSHISEQEESSVNDDDDNESISLNNDYYSFFNNKFYEITSSDENYFFHTSITEKYIIL